MNSASDLLVYIQTASGRRKWLTRYSYMMLFRSANDMSAAAISRAYGRAELTPCLPDGYQSRTRSYCEWENRLMQYGLYNRDSVFRSENRPSHPAFTYSH